jgi:hypothetical protein
MDLLKKIFDSIIEPGKQYGKLAGGAGYELYRAGKSALGDKNAYYDNKTNKTVQNPFLSEQEIQEIQQKPLETAARRTAGAASYLVPFGRGANILSKVLLPGLATGALTKASEDDTNASDIAMSGLTGMVGSGLLHGATSGVSKALSGLGGGLGKVANRVLGGQYNLSKADRIKLNLNDTIRQLADYGVKNINDVIPAAQQVTGDSGILTKLTRDAVAKAKPVDTNGLIDIATNLANDPSIPVGQDKKLIDFITKGVQSFTDTTTPELKGNPLDTFDFIKKLEGQASSIKGIAESDRAMKRAFKSVADELKSRLFEQSGANNQVVDLANNPQVLEQLAKISPKLAETAKKATSVSDLRSVAAPFVRGSQAAKKSLESEGGKLFNLTDIAAGLGGATAFGPVGAGLTLLKKAIESDKGISSISNALNIGGKTAQTIGNAGEQLFNNPAIQQALGQLGGRSVGIFPSQIQDVSNSENYSPYNEISDSRFKQGFENNHSGIIPQQSENSVNSNVANMQNVPERVNSDDQGNQWIESASGDVYSTDKQWKWDFQTNDWVPNSQSNEATLQAPVSKEQFQQLFLTDLIQNNGRNLDKLTTLQKLLSPQEDLDTQIKRADLEKKQLDNLQAKSGNTQKPLSAQAQKDVTKAKTATSAIDRIVNKLNKDPQLLWKKMINPTDQNARQLDADMKSAIDIIGYFRTGATLTKEQRNDYMSMFPTPLDDERTRKAKMQAIKEELRGYANIQSDLPENSNMLQQAMMQLQ